MSWWEIFRRALALFRALAAKFPELAEPGKEDEGPPRKYTKAGPKRPPPKSDEYDRRSGR